MKELQAKLQKAYDELKALQGLEEMNDDEVERATALTQEISALQKKIKVKQDMDATLASASAEQGKTSASTGANKVEEIQAEEAIINRRMGGYKNSAEFLKDVKAARATGTTPRRLQNTIFEKNGEDGGFLIPTDMVSGVKKKFDSDESLLSLTNSLQTSKNRVSINTDEVASWDSTAGVQAGWMEEGGSFVESKPKFSAKDIKLHKLGAVVHATEEVLEDAPMLASIISEKAPEALMHQLNKAIIDGSGAGRPKGFLNCDYTYVQPKESGQTAATINYQNIANMVSHHLGNGIWIASHTIKPQLKFLKDENNNYIYLAGASFGNAAAAPFEQLLGRRIMYLMGGVKELGNKGDLSLVDFSAYTTVIKTSSMKSDVSTHVKWLEDKTSFKFTMRVGGDCLFKSPLSPENGDFDLSKIVTLAERA